MPLTTRLAFIGYPHLPALSHPQVHLLLHWDLDLSSATYYYLNEPLSNSWTDVVKGKRRISLPLFNSNSNINILPLSNFSANLAELSNSLAPASQPCITKSLYCKQGNTKFSELNLPTPICHHQRASTLIFLGKPQT